MPLLAFIAALLLPLAAHAADPMEILWARHLLFADDGSPLITVRIDDGEQELRLRLLGPGAIEGDGRRVELPAGTRLRFRAQETRKAKVRYAARVLEVPFANREAAQAALERWRARGFEARHEVLGGVFGLDGRVIDNRRYAIRIGAPGARQAAEALLREAAAFDDAQPRLHEILEARPGGTIEVLGPAGRLARVADAVAVEAAAGVEVRAVEHDVGYASHGRSDRTYRGTVYVTIGADGRLAAVNALPLEQLVRGIVPAEIYATAPIEALKAQAVTARGEILAKIGARHLADPHAICAEQHCQVYKGRSGEHPGTDLAISATRGEVLLAGDGRLVDSVFSSTCGGHTEDNEAVWGTPPDPSLRGVPDWIDDAPALAAFAEGIEDVEAFLRAEVPAMCAVSSFARGDKFRWERRFAAAEMDEVGARLGVGAVRRIAVAGRGVSGRATALAFTGTDGAATVEGELRIRRLLGNLNSSLFVVEREGSAQAPTGWRFRGAGWGHGVGMCQTGAIGRAERGQDHRTILRHYYSGAEPVRLY